MNPSEGTGAGVVPILPGIFKQNFNFVDKARKARPNPFDYAESVFAESMLESLPSTVSQSSSSIGTISKDLSTFKERISEIKDPQSVKRLRIIFITFVLFLIGIISIFIKFHKKVTELVINIVMVRQLDQQFTFVGHLANRFSTILLAASRIRTFTSILDQDPYKPIFTEYNFTESKEYVFSLYFINIRKLQNYSASIVESHEKIIRLEEELNFKDGATPIPLMYKSKYLENEESLINYSFAVMELVVKTLQLINFGSLKEALEIREKDPDQSYIYDRTRDFLLYNTNMSLRTYTEKIVEKYLDALHDKTQSGKLLEIALNAISLGFIIILFFVMLPIVFRVVSEKSKVMKGFAYVKKSEIADILNWASAFDIRSSSKSLKLLAETRKDKVYEIMTMEKEKKAALLAKKDEAPSGEAVRTNKLRDLIRNIFKFDNEEQKEEKKEEELEGLDNSLPSGFGSLFASHEDDSKGSKNQPIDSGSKLNQILEKESKKEENTNNGSFLNNDQSNVQEPILPSEKENKQDGESEIEKLALQRKKLSLSKTEYFLNRNSKNSVSLRRRAILKVGSIFFIFVIYSALNIVYIVLFNNYASAASNQYNDIQMRIPLMSQLTFMCRQALFENDTKYLISTPGILFSFKN